VIGGTKPNPVTAAKITYTDSQSPPVRVILHFGKSSVLGALIGRGGGPYMGRTEEVAIAARRQCRAPGPPASGTS